MTKNKNILIISPHTDDAELGCGSTIYKLNKKGYNLHYIAFSSCEDSVPKKYNKNILRNEVAKSTKILGIQNKNLNILNFKVREFDKHRQEILDIMINFKRNINPFIIFTTSINDIHQDHKVIYEETIRAFKFENLLSYEIPWNTKNFKPNLYVEIKMNEFSKKIKSLSQYKSQKFRRYFDNDFIKSQLLFRGIQSKFKLAEAFEIINLNSEISI